MYVFMYLNIYTHTHIYNVCTYTHIFVYVYILAIFLKYLPLNERRMSTIENSCGSVRYLCFFLLFNYLFFFGKKSCFSYTLLFLGVKIIFVIKVRIFVSH